MRTITVEVQRSRLSGPRRSEAPCCWLTYQPQQRALPEKEIAYAADRQHDGLTAPPPAGLTTWRRRTRTRRIGRGRRPCPRNDTGQNKPRPYGGCCPVGGRPVEVT